MIQYGTCMTAKREPQENCAFKLSASSKDIFDICVIKMVRNKSQYRKPCQLLM